MKRYYEADITKRLSVGVDVQWQGFFSDWAAIELLGFGWDFVNQTKIVMVSLLGFQFDACYVTGELPKDRVELAQDLFDTEQGDDR